MLGGAKKGMRMLGHQLRCVEDHWRQHHPLDSFLSMNFLSSGGWILGIATGRNDRAGNRL